MFKNLRTIGDALTKVVVSVCGISESIENGVDAINSSTKALSRYAEDLDKGAIDDCRRNEVARVSAMKIYEEELAALEAL